MTSTKINNEPYWTGHPMNGIQLISKGGYFGLIDTSKTLLCSPKYDRIFRFNNELAVITLDNKYGVIAKTGKEIVAPKYSFISDYNNGIAWVYDDQIEKWGIIGERGDLISPIQAIGARKYQNDGVVFNGKELIKKNGEKIVDFSESDFTGAKGDRNQLWSMEGSEINFRAVDYFVNQRNWSEANGLFFEKAPTNLLFYYSEGLAIVPKNVDGQVKLGYIDEKGEVIIPAIYDDAQHFCNGKACVKLNGKWGEINRKGNFIIQPKYEYLEETSADYLIMKEDGGFGIINRSEQLINNPDKDILAIQHIFGDVFALLKATPETESGMMKLGQETPHINIHSWGAMNVVSRDTLIPFSFHLIRAINEELAVGINYAFSESTNPNFQVSDITDMPPPSPFKGKGIVTTFNDRRKISRYETENFNFFDLERGTTRQLNSIIPFRRVGEYYQINDSFFDKKGVEIVDQKLLKTLLVNSNKTKLYLFSDPISGLIGCKDFEENVVLNAEYNDLILASSGIIAHKAEADLWMFFDLLGLPVVSYNCNKMEETNSGVIKIYQGNDVFIINKKGQKITN